MDDTVASTTSTAAPGADNARKVFLSIPDVVVLVVYFVACVTASLVAMYRNRRRGTTTKGYFLAGGTMTWLTVGSSLFASNIGSEHYIGLAGSGAANGLAVAAFELNALLLLQVLGWIFLPIYIASGVQTLPEYITRRFGGRRIHVYLATISLLIYVFTKVSVNLYSGALFIRQSVDWDLSWSIGAIIVLTGICTVTGGLSAVMYMDTLQAFLMVGGGLTLMVYALSAVGGIAGLWSAFPLAGPVILAPTDVDGAASVTMATRRATPPANGLKLLRAADDAVMPWPGFVFGQTAASIWYWCADQVIVQRALAAKNLPHAQGGALFAGYLKLLPMFMIVMPGMAARVLFPDEVACATPAACLEVCGEAKGCSNIAYPLLVTRLLPDGLRGLLLAVMLAALMSDLTSIFNSAASLFTLDLYPSIRRVVYTKSSPINRIFLSYVVSCRNIHGEKNMVKNVEAALVLWKGCAMVVTGAVAAGVVVYTAKQNWDKIMDFVRETQESGTTHDVKALLGMILSGSNQSAVKKYVSGSETVVRLSEIVEFRITSIVATLTLPGVIVFISVGVAGGYVGFRGAQKVHELWKRRRNQTQLQMLE